MNETCFERVHRLPTRHNSQTCTKPRPTIAKFSFYQDKEYVMSKVKNLKGIPESEFHTTIPKRLM